MPTPCPAATLSALALVAPLLLGGTAAAQVSATPDHGEVWRPSDRWSTGLQWQRQMAAPDLPAPQTRLVPAPLSAAATATTQVLVVGASVRTGERSRLSLQAPIALTTPTGDEVRTAGARQMQLAWSMQQREATPRWRSPLRMSLSGQTVVTLKPRKSKVSVTLQHQW